jgi:lauroyl/myristoyl acyltransferase
MDLISMATSRNGLSMVRFLCRVLPPRAIRLLGRWFAAYLARRDDLPFVQALASNLAVVHGLPAGHPRVCRAVARLLENTVVSYADLFQMLEADARDVSTRSVRAVCELDPAMQQAIDDCLTSRQGLVLVGAHMCSFDILLLGLREVVPTVQILTNAQPKGSSKVMNRIREEQGLLVTPLSVHSLRQAIDRLRQGGVVALAADLPVEGGELLTFFGQACQLPVGHTRLALGTGAQVLVGASHRIGDGVYQVEFAPAPRPATSGDRRQDVIRWAQLTLHLLEGYIQQWPEEWLMPVPIWSAAGS